MSCARWRFLWEKTPVECAASSYSNCEHALTRNRLEQVALHQRLKLADVCLELQLQAAAVRVDRHIFHGALFGGVPRCLLIEQAGVQQGRERARGEGVRGIYVQVEVHPMLQVE